MTLKKAKEAEDYFVEIIEMMKKQKREAELGRLLIDYTDYYPRLKFETKQDFNRKLIDFLTKKTKEMGLSISVNS